MSCLLANKESQQKYQFRSMVGGYAMSNAREQRAIIVLAVEHTLLKMSSSMLEKVEFEIHSKYNCTIADCYEHPEYLASVLRDLLGSAYSEVVNNVKAYLEEFTYQKPIQEFLEKIR